MAREEKVTPTWSGLLPIYIMAIRNADLDTGDGAKGYDAAVAELKNMAIAADRWNAFCRKQEQGLATSGNTD